MKERITTEELRLIKPKTGKTFQMKDGRALENARSQVYVFKRRSGWNMTASINTKKLTITVRRS